MNGTSAIFALSCALPFLVCAVEPIRPALGARPFPFANGGTGAHAKRVMQLNPKELKRIEHCVRGESKAARGRVEDGIRKAERMTAEKVMRDSGVENGLKHEKMDPSLAKQVRENAEKSAAEMRRLAQQANENLNRPR